MSKILLRVPRFFLVLAGIVLATVLGFALQVASGPDRYDAERVQLVALEMKIRAFQLDTGALPDSLEALLVPAGVIGWRGPYARQTDLTDPIGRRLHYERRPTSAIDFRLVVLDARGAVTADVDSAR